MITEGPAKEQETAAAVELIHISKSFGPVLANEDVSFRVQRGTIHGIVGENGAGKSTAMKLLYGMCRPDAGQIRMGGQNRSWKSPADAIRAGIGMVHQHFMLAGRYSALDNILLGAEPMCHGLLDRKAARQQLSEIARKYGLALDWDHPVEDLPLGVQQRVEILKLLFRSAEILILDEPTAVLTPQESSRLFANLLELRNEGKTVLLVTHKLKEVLTFTDTVTVFRHGKVAGHLITKETDAQSLARLMVGRKVVMGIEVPPAKPSADLALEVCGLTLASGGSRHKLHEATLSVCRGEIVGVAGVEGNGQSELVEAILHPADADSRASGRVKFLGHDVTRWPAARIRELGVAVIPEDRIRSGLLLNRPLTENLLLGFQRSRAPGWFGFLNPRKLREAACRALEQHDIRSRDPGLNAGNLSGGTQQKLVFAREFQREPAVVIASQPTRGVDVGATEAIHKIMVRARDHGAGVLLVSSDLDEILTLSDRILVMYEGRVVAEFSRGQATERELGLKMGGA